MEFQHRQAPSPHQGAEEQQRDDDERERGALSRQDSHDHPHRDRHHRDDETFTQ